MVSVDLLLKKNTVLWLNEDDESGNSSGDGGNSAGDQGGGSHEEKPFLQVNDRTVYKTAEDAKRGYEEAQTRITSLSNYEKVLKELGAPDGADHEYLKGVLTEYLRLAQEAKAQKAAASAKVTPSAEDKEFEGVDPQVVAQTKRGRQWLKENAEKVGLISQEKYDKLVKDFEEFKGGFTQKDAEERQEAIDEGQQKVSDWLKDAKVTLTDPERLKLENAIAAYINSDRTLTGRWLKGSKTEKLDLIKEGYTLFLPVVKPGASPAVKAASAVTAGKTKIGLMNRTKNLPQNGSGNQQTQGKAKPMRIGDPSLRAKAFEMIKSLDAEADGAGE